MAGGKPDGPGVARGNGYHQRLCQRGHRDPGGAECGRRAVYQPGDYRRCAFGGYRFWPAEHRQQFRFRPDSVVRASGEDW